MPFQIRYRGKTYTVSTRVGGDESAHVGVRDAAAGRAREPDMEASGDPE